MGYEVHSEIMQSFRMYLWDVHICSIEFGRRDITARRKKIYFKKIWLNKYTDNIIKYYLFFCIFIGHKDNGSA